MLNAKSFYLRELVEEDLSLVLQWRNLEHVRQFMFNITPITWEEHTQWFESLHNNDSQQVLIFSFLDQPLGVVQLTQIDKAQGTCHWGFYLGEWQRPRGVGTIMGYLALEHVFQSLGMLTCYGEVIRKNAASLNFHKKLGFTQEHQVRPHIRDDGSSVDVILFALRKDEWNQHKSKLGD